MSTTMPESVTTAQTTTTTPATATTTTIPPNPTIISSSTTVSSEPTLTEKAKTVAVQTGTAIASAAHTAGTAIASAAHSASTAVSNAAHDFDSRHHVSDKVSDMTSHVGAALKQGNPIHAAKHIGTAATIGEAERVKHEHGPLPEGAHVAPTVGSVTSSNPVPNSSSTSASLSGSASAAASNLSNSASTLGKKISDSATDAASFAGAAISQGNPIHAAKYASTAATIGAVEREKHEHGPLTDETEIARVTHH